MASWENFNENDEYYTPKYIFDALGCEFDMDVAAPVDLTYVSTPAKQFIHEDSLNFRWNGFVWMNPPYSGRNGKSVWLDKFAENNNGIALMPDRTSAPWWPVAAKKAYALLFVYEKIKFIKPDCTVEKSPGNGTTFFAHGEKGVNALYTAEHSGLGLVLKR